MKKVILAVLFCSLFFTLPKSTPAAEYSLVVGDKFLGRVEIRDYNYQRTMIPVRTACEALGWEVEWEEQGKIVVLSRGETSVQIPVNEHIYIINNNISSLEFAAVLDEGTVYVPAAFFTRSAICRLNWDGQLKALHMY